MPEPFRVGVTHDFLKPDGTLGFGDIGLALLDEAPHVAWEFLAENTPVLRREQIEGYDALLVLAPRITAETLRDNQRLQLIARFGVGYDSVDVEACTANGVLVTITPDGVRRPVAVAIITFMLALSHNLLLKDRITREGRWGEKLDYMGVGLTGKTLGIIGLGNIGKEVLQLVQPFEMRHLAYDPYVKRAAGVQMVTLDTLLRLSDFGVVCCALTPETHHLLDGERLALMKPTAYVINTARGPIIDEAALTIALQERRIRGAALDVFEQEPLAPDHPLLTLDNVIVAPHAICWTDECFLGVGRSACQSIVDVASGRRPRHIVNPEALNHPRFGALRETSPN